MVKLTPPSIEYKTSFLEALAEYQNESRYAELNPVELTTNFDAFVEKVKSYAKGENLPEGYVPESDFWLVDGNEFIGNLKIRHALTKDLKKIGGHIGYDIRPSKRRQGHGTKILELGLQKVHELCIEKVLITCDITNVGSRKIIEKNGGILENEIEQGQGKPKRLRFWIDINESL